MKRSFLSFAVWLCGLAMTSSLGAQDAALLLPPPDSVPEVVAPKPTPMAPRRRTAWPLLKTVSHETYLPPVNKRNAPVVDGAAFCPIFAAPQRVPPRFSIRHDIGDGVGYELGFTSIEAFVPVWQAPDDSVLFTNLRATNFDDIDRWEYNLGGGFRKYSERCNAVLGVNAFYDGRHTETNFFHQLGIGLEALWRLWEVRLNGYFVMGPDNRIVSDTGFLPARVVGDKIIRDRVFVSDLALTGAEFEVGRALPVFERFSPRGFVGVYTYSVGGVPAATGVRGRLESQIGRRITAHLSASYDELFDTTVQGGLAIHFGGTPQRFANSESWIRNRLGQRVNRDLDIVIIQGVENKPEVQDVPPPPPPPPPPDPPPLPLPPTLPPPIIIDPEMEPDEEPEPRRT